MDPTRVGAYGGSYGGYYAANAVLRHPDVYRAAVAAAGSASVGFEKFVVQGSDADIEWRAVIAHGGDRLFKRARRFRI
ncbi:MAG: prolyl oligopeptidase family serine peptidase, partial [Pseudomonadota bacterium]